MCALPLGCGGFSVYGRPKKNWKSRAPQPVYTAEKPERRPLVYTRFQIYGGALLDYNSKFQRKRIDSWEGFFESNYHHKNMSERVVQWSKTSNSKLNAYCRFSVRIACVIIRYSSSRTYFTDMALDGWLPQKRRGQLEELRPQNKRKSYSQNMPKMYNGCHSYLISHDTSTVWQRRQQSVKA